jgi:predicted murein hydrolase (TIGR00659 family)
MSDLFTSPLFFILLTLGIYTAAGVIHKKSGLIFLQPVLVTVCLLIAYLSLSDTKYETYMTGGRLIHFFLGPSVVALALPLYRKLRQLRREAPAILASVFFGSIIGIISVTVPLLLLGVPTELVASLAAKSVTTPIAMAITEGVGGIPSLSAGVVVLTGILGAVIGPPVLRLCGIVTGTPFGLAMGSAAHGIGTARALEEGELEGASSGLAIGVNGIMTAVLVPLLLPLLLPQFSTPS